MWPSVSFRDHASEAAPAREAEASRLAEGNRSPTLVIAAAAGVAVVVVAGVALALANGGDDGPGDARPALEAAGCTVTAVDALRGVHSITTPDGSSDEWNTDPPTSGAHYEVPVIWGSYDEPVNQAQLVHNLEHGGVAIQYGDEVPPATVEQLESFVQENSRGTVLAPLPSLGNQIALGAWVDRERVGAGQGHRVPREVHGVRRGRVPGVPRRVPVPRPRAVPAGLAAARQHVGAARRRRYAGRAAGVAELVRRGRLKTGCPSGHRGSTPSPGT